MAEESKRAKYQHEKEDRISTLPDSLIQHILSLLPSTKEAIRTSVLSKRWCNQWTRVPVLIFSNSGMSNERFSRFIDNTLLRLDCSKIQKFHILSENYQVRDDPTITSKVHFALRKGVEELLLEFKGSREKFRLPGYIFDYASLVKLQLYNCTIMTNGVVSWGRLKELSIECSSLYDAAIESILIGSPLLEMVQLTDCFGPSQLKIASESLKKIVLQLLRHPSFSLEVLCPKLEELELSGYLGESSIEFKDLLTLNYATLDFDGILNAKSLFETLQQFQHVKELTFGSKFIEALSNLKESVGKCCWSLNNKSLTLEQPDFGEHHLGIVRALIILPRLETLVIEDLVCKPPGLSTNSWDSNAKALKNLVPCLKTVHIVGSRKSSASEVPFDFVDFILKSSPVIENLVVLKD